MGEGSRADTHDGGWWVMLGLICPSRRSSRLAVQMRYGLRCVAVPWISRGRRMLGAGLGGAIGK